MIHEPQGPGAAPAAKPLRRLPSAPLGQTAKTKESVPHKLVPFGLACRLLRRTRATVHRWIRRGLVRAVHVGFRTYIRREDIDWWLSPHVYTGRPPVPPWLETPEPRARGTATERIAEVTS